MIHSIHQNEETRIRSHSALKLSVRSLFLATAIITGIAYLICILFMTVAPQATMTLFSYVLHLNLSGITPNVTWGSFIVGLLFWSVGIGLYAAFVARLYNKLPVR
ncbi:hypothetical protein C7B67_27785 [filamentous cyanobacterium Phorm 6]|nr:hypothetical protein C7B67_27785 [filamentous cyanobacterium Phorm 6]